MTLCNTSKQFSVLFHEINFVSTTKNVFLSIILIFGAICPNKAVKYETFYANLFTDVHDYNRLDWTNGLIRHNTIIYFHLIVSIAMWRNHCQHVAWYKALCKLQRFPLAFALDYLCGGILHFLAFSVIIALHWTCVSQLLPIVLESACSSLALVLVVAGQSCVYYSSFIMLH